MSEITDKEIDEVIKHITEFKEIQTAQKKRGLNDANVFTTLLSQSDEVRLHSRFLKFLLDPNANHYQDDLFLKEFLKQVGLSDFGLKTENTKAYNEYANIDIYLTDGTRHIILENKIWAGDQKEQIERYIETVQKENKDLKNEYLAVIYLTPTGWQLSEWSLKGDDEKGFDIKDGYLINTEKEVKYKYKQLSYKSHIISWLDAILSEIQNITNLSIMITQYKEVVEKVLGTHKEKVMDLGEYLKDKTDKEEIIKKMELISTEYQDYKYKLMKHFWENVEEKVKGRLPINWEIFFHNKDKLVNGSRHGNAPFRIYNKISEKHYDDVIEKLYFGFEYNEDNHKQPFVGLYSRGILENHLIKEKYYNRKDIMLSSHWINFTYFIENNMYDYVIQNENAVDNVVNWIIGYFEENRSIVEEINKNFELYKK